MAVKTHSVFDPAIILPAIGEAFRKLNPVTLAKNPVMLVTEVGAAISTILLVTGHGANFGFQFQIALWIWFIVLVANFAEAMAEGRGKAQAKALRGTQTQTLGNRRKLNGAIEKVAAEQLRKDDVVVVSAGELIPGDGEVIEGAATVDESAITGESAPVIRESGIAPLNIMFLKSPQSAILSGLIFNAIIIIALIPLALKGVRFQPLGAAEILARNLVVYGLGGIPLPFIGIKLIEMIIITIGLA